MPAIDKCEESIIKALEKEGWIVLDQPYLIKFADKKYVYADLELINRQSEEIIIVEVKCFPNAPLDSFYGAVGQYILYRLLLRKEEISAEIFLAIPQSIYQTLFEFSAIQDIIDEAKIKLIVVDLEREEVTSWKT